MFRAFVHISHAHAYAVLPYRALLALDHKVAHVLFICGSGSRGRSAHRNQQAVQRRNTQDSHRYSPEPQTQRVTLPSSSSSWLLYVGRGGKVAWISSTSLDLPLSLTTSLSFGTRLLRGGLSSPASSSSSCLRRLAIRPSVGAGEPDDLDVDADVDCGGRERGARRCSRDVISRVGDRKAE